MSTLLKNIAKNRILSLVSYRVFISVGPVGSLGVIRGNKKGAAPVELTKKIKFPRKVFKVYRFGGTACGGKPKVASYNIDVTKIGKMLLDALLFMKEMDPTLSFRRSCREGICGSCAMNIQGSNVLACIKTIPDVREIRIYPLPHMYVIRDLVVDMDFFYEGYNSIRPYIVRNQPIPLGTNQYAQSIKDNEKMLGLYECVLCACCSTGCPSYWWNGRRFLGPASLLHAYRWVIDSRDEDTESRLSDLRDDFRAYRCHAIFLCSVTCPRGLQPGRYIQLLKRLIAGLDKKPAPELDPMLFAGGGSGRGPC